MKKVLATVAALGLVLGVAGNVLALDKPGAQAESETTTAPRVPQATAPGVSLWSVSGSWALAGALLSNGMGAPGNANVMTETANDAFYFHSFKLLPVLQVNDKVSVKGELRFIDRSTFGTESTTKGAEFNSYHLYVEWMSPMGKTRFGRTPAGAWGSKFLNSTSQGNRLMLWGNWMPENMGMLLFTQKVSENDAATFNVADQDTDAYYIDVSYNADFGKTIVALWNVRNAATAATAPFMNSALWLYGKYAFDNISLEYEGRINFGEASATVDQKSYGFYADLGMNMGDMTIGGLFIYASGDDNPADLDAENVLGSAGTGNDFNPYQIMMGDYMGLLCGDNPLTAGGDTPAFLSNAGVISLGLYGKFKASPKMTFSGELGYFMAESELTGWDDEIGIEVGMGMSYKLYNNLTYNAHLSYLMTGDFFKMGVAANPTEDVYLLAHSLSMTF